MKPFALAAAMAAATMACALVPAFGQGLAPPSASPVTQPTNTGPDLPHSYLLEPMRGLLNQANAPVKKPAAPPPGQLSAYGNGLAVPPPPVPPLPPQDQPYQ